MMHTLANCGDTAQAPALKEVKMEQAQRERPGQCEHPRGSSRRSALIRSKIPG